MSIILETKRLILKVPTQSDFDDLLKLRTDPDVMQYIGTGAIQTEAQVKEFIEKSKPYYDQYALGFYSVFEKETNRFVGQAGLFHLNYNDSQSEIEVAYRLHPHYWHKGYATELAKALIEHGFHQLALSRIIAIVHPKNERSRKVMEKAGMSYYGMIEHNGSPIPCYEIFKNTFHLNEIKLIPATINDYPTIQNMGRFYAYDMSEYFGNDKTWAMPENGLYECIDFKKYWHDKNSFPFLIRYQNEFVGFVIVDKKGSASDIDFNMAQFFIVRKFKNKGIGKVVAEMCFNQFQGVWEIMVIPGNEGAYRFWRSVIKHYTNNHFEEYTHAIAHFKGNIKNIFRFNT